MNCEQWCEWNYDGICTCEGVKPCECVELTVESNGNVVDFEGRVVGHIIDQERRNEDNN